VFHHTTKHFEVRQKYSATRPIFNTLLAARKCGQTRSFVFDILLLTSSSGTPSVQLILVIVRRNGAPGASGINPGTAVVSSAAINEGENTAVAS